MAVLNVFSLQNSKTRPYYYVQDCAFPISKNEVRLSFSHPISSVWGSSSKSPREKSDFFGLKMSREVSVPKESPRPSARAPFPYDSVSIPIPHECDCENLCQSFMSEISQWFREIFGYQWRKAKFGEKGGGNYVSGWSKSVTQCSKLRSIEIYPIHSYKSNRTAPHIIAKPKFQFSFQSIPQSKSSFPFQTVSIPHKFPSSKTTTVFPIRSKVLSQARAPFPWVIHLAFWYKSRFSCAKTTILFSECPIDYVFGV